MLLDCQLQVVLIFEIELFTKLGLVLPKVFAFVYVVIMELVEVSVAEESELDAHLTTPFPAFLLLHAEQFVLELLSC